jgi:protein-S-isoprenylcysteine O-methyltransferase Ste14
LKPESEAPADEERHGPAVRVHPPVIYAISILIGIGLHNAWPLYMPYGFYGRLYGGIILGLATLIALFAILEFNRAGTDIRPDRPDSKLITTGPYRFSRNPLYIVLGLAQVTVAVWLNNAWILMMTVPSVLVITYYAIAREERYLEKLFGQDYLDYKRRVRRWF